MAEDFTARFFHVLLELRERDLKPYERLAAEEILLLTYGQGRAQVIIRRLDHLAARLGISRGNLHPHLSQLVRLQVLASDERPGRHAETWWLNEPGVWQIGRRVEPGTERGHRAATATTCLLADNPLLPGQRELPGFEPEQTDAEVQADAALERAGQSPTSNLSAAASASARPGPDARSKIWNDGSKIWNELVPKSGTAVPNFGTGEAANAPACTRAWPGFQSQEPEARLRGRASREPGQERYRALNIGEQGILDELEAWCAEGPDTTDEIARHRATWSGRIRWKGSSFVERCLREAQLRVRENPRLVRKTRGGFLQAIFDDLLRLVPPPVDSGPAALVTTTLVPGSSTATDEERENARRHLADWRQACRGGRPPSANLHAPPTGITRRARNSDKD